MILGYLLRCWYSILIMLILRYNTTQPIPESVTLNQYYVRFDIACSACMVEIKHTFNCFTSPYQLKLTSQPV